MAACFGADFMRILVELLPTGCRFDGANRQMQMNGRTIHRDEVLAK